MVAAHPTLIKPIRSPFHTLPLPFLGRVGVKNTKSQQNHSQRLMMRNPIGLLDWERRHCLEPRPAASTA